MVKGSAGAPGLKVAALVAGTLAGADSIDDMALLRHDGMRRIIAPDVHALDASVVPAGVTFGHVRQFDAVAPRFLVAVAGFTDSWTSAPVPASGHNEAEYALFDVDDTIIAIHGRTKQGAGFGYSGVRRLNALLATLATATSARVIVAQRLREVSAGPPRGANRLVGDAVPLTVRMDKGMESGKGEP